MKKIDDHTISMARDLASQARLLSEHIALFTDDQMASDGADRALACAERLEFWAALIQMRPKD